MYERRGIKKAVNASVLDGGEVIENDHAEIRVEMNGKGRCDHIRRRVR